MASSTPLLLLLLAVGLLSVSAEFVSIDCGSSDSFTDENTIKWDGDGDYVFSSSKTYTVQNTTGWPRVMTTMRVFSAKKKNCYSIKIEKGSQYLVRASFLYGNYDKKSAPPSFRLLLDGNLWSVVETSVDLVSNYELIYIPLGDYIDVCVAQTKPNQLPFISAIEIRGLDSEMYNYVNSDYAMIRTNRVAFGATEMIRYPSDDYDRLWRPATITNANGLVKLTNDAQIIDTSVPNQPPVAVFQYAIGTSTSTTLSLFPSLPDFEVPIYIILYFTEMSVLNSRSFEVQIDGKSPFEPIVPNYASVTEFSITNTTASSKTTFNLVATSDSTLSPLISAMEVYYISQITGNATDSKDVAALAVLQAKFNVLEEWTSDPCLPFPYIWDWVNCSSDDTPRITALYLNGYGLSGELPDFSDLDALETIDLHNNSLSGGIPSFLGTLSNLQELNLADNKLSGPIPITVSQNKKLKLDTSGNSDLCASGGSCKTINSSPSTDGSGSGSGSGKKKKSSNIGLIVGLVVGAVSVVATIVIVALCCVAQSKRRASGIAAMGTGQYGNGNGLPQGGPMNAQMGGQFGEVMMNQQYEVNVQEQGAPNPHGGLDPQGTPEPHGTPEQFRNVEVEERPIHY